MNATGTYVLVGAAIAAPMLLVEARDAGLPVPAFVTEAQVAACTQLASPVLGVPSKDAQGRQRLLARFLEVRQAMVGLRGAAEGDTKRLFAKLSDVDISELCTRFLAAARAGVAASSNDLGRKATDGGYVVTLAPDVAGVHSNAAVLDELMAGFEPSFPLTTLGAAIQRVVALKTAAEFGEPEPIEAQQTLAHLAIECDDVGYLVTGDPVSFDVIGPLEALGVSGTFLAELPVKATAALAELVGDTAAGIVMSTPGLLALAAFIAWRKFR